MESVPASGQANVPSGRVVGPSSAALGQADVPSGPFVGPSSAASGQANVSSGPVLGPSWHVEGDAILDIIRRVNGDGMGVVQGAVKLEAELRKRDLVYDTTISPRQVGFDPVNREGKGGNAQEVLLLASDIAFVGWSWAETSHAMCVETLPGDLTVEQFNRQLCDGVGLAPVEHNSISFGSLSCGHTNMALRAIGASMPSDCPLLSEGGRFSVHKLGLRDPEFARAVELGLKWTVLRASIRTTYPEALRIFQAAKNVAGHVARQSNEMQGLVQLHAMGASSQAAGKAIDWPAIRRAVLRARPPFAESVDGMIAFIATRSGGTDGAFLKYLAAFYRQFVNPSVRRCLPPALYSELADFPYHYVALAIWEAAYSCPLDGVKQGICGWISAAEVAAVARAARGEKKDMLGLSEQVLSQARVRFASTGVADQIPASNKLVGIMAKLDIAMARFVLSKQGASKQAFASPHAVGLNFAKELKAAYPQADITEFEVMWPAEVASKAEVRSGGTDAAAPAAASIELYTVGASGDTVSVRAQLRSKGWDIGAVLCEKEDLQNAGPSEAVLWRIDSVCDSSVAVTLRKDLRCARTYVRTCGGNIISQIYFNKI